MSKWYPAYDELRSSGWANYDKQNIPIIQAEEEETSE